MLQACADGTVLGLLLPLLNNGLLPPPVITEDVTLLCHEKITRRNDKQIMFTYLAEVAEEAAVVDAPAPARP